MHNSWHWEPKNHMMCIFSVTLICLLPSLLPIDFFLQKWFILEKYYFLKLYSSHNFVTDLGYEFFSLSSEERVKKIKLKIELAK